MDDNATWLRQALQNSGLSQSELARRMGVGPDIINKIVLGRRKMSFAEVRAISSILQIPPPGFSLSSVSVQIAGVPVMGRVEPNLWRNSAVSGTPTGRFVPGVIDPRFPIDDQAALELAERTQDGEFRAGDFLIYVDFRKYRVAALPTDTLITRLTKGDMETYGLVRAISDGKLVKLVPLLSPGAQAHEILYLVIGVHRSLA